MTVSKKKKRSKLRLPIPIAALCAAEIVLIGLGLLTFAYFHHVQPQHIESLNIVSSRPGNMAA